MGPYDKNRLETLRKDITNVHSKNFRSVALRVFRYQAYENPLFKQWLNILEVDPDKVNTPEEIPFFPIRFFKDYLIQTSTWKPELVFSSSGTTGMEPSKHLLRDLDRYLSNTVRGFGSSYGPVGEYAWLCLLPSYLERKGSSLIAMAKHFIDISKYPESGFYLHNLDELAQKLSLCLYRDIPVVLLGVSFALQDMAEAHPMPLKNCIVMETGGMKGRREEITRQSLHHILTNAFEVESVHSEYGMTELLSQAYSKGSGVFEPSPTMRVYAREITDPLHRPAYGRTGALDIIDLANVDTISFIATDDLGKVNEDLSFEVLGRMDDSDIRGCNLLVT